MGACAFSFSDGKDKKEMEICLKDRFFISQYLSVASHMSVYFVHKMDDI